MYSMFDSHMASKPSSLSDMMGAMRQPKHRRRASLRVAKTNIPVQSAKVSVYVTYA